MLIFLFYAGKIKKWRKLIMQMIYFVGKLIKKGSLKT